MKYEVIIYWSGEDRRFIAEMPELCGCIAEGHTHAKALNAVGRIAKEWIETAKKLGRPIPQPRGRLMYS